MKNSNPTRDLAKNVGAATTPVQYRSSGAVYRSLAAVPSQIDVDKAAQPRVEKQFSTLVGPQTKSQGEVVWSETKNKNVPVGKEAHPLPIPLILANAPHNSLFVESNPVSKVVSAVHGLFEQHSVDVQYNEQKFKWKCACYDAHNETRFVSRLFSVPDKANYFVLDFQRRSGDPFHFQSIYKSINFKLLKSGFVVPCNEGKTAVEPAIRTFRPMALPADFFANDGENDEEKDAKEFEPLMKMCASPFLDVQREGLIAIANNLERDDFARKSLASFAEKLIETVSMSRDIQIRRLATSALANLSQEAASHAYIKEKAGLRVIVNMLVDENELLETRRQAGRILRNVRDWDSDIAAIIKRAHIAKDSRLTQLMKELQARML